MRDSLRVLLLVDKRHTHEATSIARALSARHQVLGHDGEGLLGVVGAARASNQHQAQIVHSIGVRDGALAAYPVANGILVPLVASVTRADFELSAKAALIRVRVSNAVLLEDAAMEQELRAQKIARDLDVLAAPRSSEDDEIFLAALESIYSRAIANYVPRRRLGKTTRVH